MSEETQTEETTVTEETPEVEVNPLQDDLDSMKADNERLNAKLSEANKHTKAAEKKQKDDQRSRDEESGNYKQLFESSEVERKKLQVENETMVSDNASEKVTNEALKIASSMADGPNAELLATFIKGRLKFDDGSVKVLDVNGNLTVSSLDDLKKEFSASDRYASLVSGSKSSGGGANGGSNGGSAAKTMKASEFHSKPPNERMKFMKAGGKLEQD